MDQAFATRSAAIREAAMEMWEASPRKPLIFTDVYSLTVRNTPPYVNDNFEMPKNVKF